MAVRKTSKDPAAREALQMIVDRAWDSEERGDVAYAFDGVEFDRIVTRIGGQPVAMRRLVLTGRWEADPNPPTEPAK